MYQRSSCLNSDPTGRSVRLSRPLGSIVAVCNGVAGVRPGRAFAALFQYAFWDMYNSHQNPETSQSHFCRSDMNPWLIQELVMTRDWSEWRKYPSFSLENLFMHGVNLYLLSNLCYSVPEYKCYDLEDKAHYKYFGSSQELSYLPSSSWESCQGCPCWMMVLMFSQLKGPIWNHLR